ncbi:hypothetical protein J7E62_27145 [Variovorax paradoxus]|nr:hypothetical protein [Variovorax paradoxus]
MSAMFDLRAILLWLMMLALPFQGYAAAAMAFCAAEPATESAVGMPHDHAEHDHASPAQGAAHHHADADVDADHPAAQDPSKSSHKCGTCAACHSVGLMPTLDLPRVHGLPQADLAEPLHAMTNVSPRIPHKPPRA